MRHVLQKTVSLILLPSFLFFAACSEENESSLPQGEDANILVPVNIFAEGIGDMGNEELESRSANEEASLTFVYPLEDGFSFVGTWEVEKMKETSSRATALPADIYYRILAFKKNGENLEYQTFKDLKKGSESLDPLMLPVGEYQFYAYSVNSTDPNSLNLLNPTLSEHPNKIVFPDDGYIDSSVNVSTVLYKKIGIHRVENGKTNNLSFNFGRLCSQLQVVLDGGNSSLTMTSGNVTVDKCQKGKEYDFLGNQWISESAVAGSQFAVNGYPITASKRIHSGIRYLCPGKRSLTISIENLTLAVLPGSPKNITHTISDFLFEPNKKYVFTGKVLPPPSVYGDIEVAGRTWCGANSYTYRGVKADYPWTYSTQLRPTDLHANGYYWPYGGMSPTMTGASLIYGDTWPETEVNNQRTCPIGYRLPTKEDFDALIGVDNCWGSYTWEDSKGPKQVFGRFFGVASEPADADKHRYLFLPAMGHGKEGVNDVINDQQEGFYWSATTDMNSPVVPHGGFTYHQDAYYLYFTQNIAPQVRTSDKCSGYRELFPIRCVKKQ